MKPKIDYLERFYVALKRIAAYDSPARLRRDSEKSYGLGFEEALEGAYENIQQEARDALKGFRKPKPTAGEQEGPTMSDTQID